MANLKDLKTRISSVKSTQKITKAMHMVAASKLRRAQENAERARPYSEKLERTVEELAKHAIIDTAPELLSGHRTADGKQKNENILLLVATADKGLCGGFNSSIVKETREQIRELQRKARNVKIITIGKKGAEQLATTHQHLVIDHIDTTELKQPEFDLCEDIGNKVIELFDNQEIDACHIIYNRFITPLEQKVTIHPLAPLMQEDDSDEPHEDDDVTYEFEPDEVALLSYLLPHNIAVQIYSALLENSASEQGARMTAMDNATRNAGDMINDLTLEFNRTRQAAITTELTEIISGAEAL